MVSVSLPVILRLWGSYTSSPMICSSKLSRCRRASTSQRWSQRLWTFTCPRSSRAWSSPSCSTTRPKEESRWLFRVSLEMRLWPVVVPFLVNLETARESVWFLKWTCSSTPRFPRWSWDTGRLQVDITRRAYSTLFYSCNCICSSVSSYCLSSYCLHIKCVPSSLSFLQACTPPPPLPPPKLMNGHVFTLITWQRVMARDKTLTGVHVAVALLCSGMTFGFGLFHNQCYFVHLRRTGVVDWQLISSWGMHTDKPSCLTSRPTKTNQKKKITLTHWNNGWLMVSGVKWQWNS